MPQARQDLPWTPPKEVWTRAASLRADARSLRTRSGVLRERAEHLSDAMVLILLETDTGRSDAREEFTFRAGSMRSAVALARLRLRRWLEAGGIDPREAADITLALSEACANAIEHPVRRARHAFEVEGRRTNAGIELTVRDFGAWRRAGDTADRGRGLAMIERLMDATEIVTDGDQTNVIMRRASRAR